MLKKNTLSKILFSVFCAMFYVSAFAATDNPGLSEEQAQAIVSLTLGRLSGLERQKVMDRIEKLAEMVAEYRSILADENKIKEILKQELSELL